MLRDRFALSGRKALSLMGKQLHMFCTSILYPFIAQPSSSFSAWPCQVSFHLLQLLNQMILPYLRYSFI